MKKLFFALLFCGIGSMYAQTISTSEEEYNYLTKGYPESIEKGLDIKDGYELKQIDEATFASCKVLFYQFNSLKENATKAYFIKRIDNTNPKKTRYYCIAINNEVLFKKFTYENSNDPLQHSFAVCLVKLLTRKN